MASCVYDSPPGTAFPRGRRVPLTRKLVGQALESIQPLGQEVGGKMRWEKLENNGNR